MTLRKDIYTPHQYKNEFIYKPYDFGGSRRRRIDTIFEDYPNLDQNKLTDFLYKLYFYKLCQLGILPSFFVNAPASEVLEFEEEFGAKFPMDQQHTLKIYDDLELVHEVMSANYIPMDKPPTYGTLNAVASILHDKGKPLSEARILMAMKDLYEDLQSRKKSLKETKYEESNNES